MIDFSVWREERREIDIAGRTVPFSVSLAMKPATGPGEAEDAVRQIDILLAERDHKIILRFLRMLSDEQVVELKVRVDFTTEDFELSKYAPTYDRQFLVNCINICSSPLEFTGQDPFCECSAISPYYHGTDILPDYRGCSNREIRRSGTAVLSLCT
jgi:hypothetical protein